MTVEATGITVEIGEHVAHLFEHEQELVTTVGAYLAGAIRDGDVAVVIATDEHRRAYEGELLRAGIDVAQATRAGSLVALDAAATLARFHAGGVIDAARFAAVVGGLIREAGSGGRRIRAYGEMVTLLWNAGQVTTAMELESLWNGLGEQVPFALLCAYPARSDIGADESHLLDAVCRLHSAVLGGPSGPAEERRSFGPVVEAPAAARRFVVDALGRLGLGHVADDAALVLTELATNAVVHARSPFTVVVTRIAQGVRIAVHDASRVRPTPYDDGLTALSGRGLSLVGALASHWAAELTADGKVVWADLRA